VWDVPTSEDWIPPAGSAGREKGKKGGGGERNKSGTTPNKQQEACQIKNSGARSGQKTAAREKRKWDRQKGPGKNKMNFPLHWGRASKKTHKDNAYS